MVFKGLVPMTCEELFHEIQEKKQKQRDVTYEVWSFFISVVDLSSLSIAGTQSSVKCMVINI